MLYSVENGRDRTLVHARSAKEAAELLNLAKATLTVVVTPATGELSIFLPPSPEGE